MNTAAVRVGFVLYISFCFISIDLCNAPGLLSKVQALLWFNNRRWKIEVDGATQAIPMSEGSDNNQTEAHLMTFNLPEI